MNNDFINLNELSIVDIVYLKVACTMAKELCNDVTDWDLLRDKLDILYEHNYHDILNID